MESDFDPVKGFTVSFTHIEDSGTYDCRVVDNDDHYIQFQIIVDPNSESNDDMIGNNVVNSTFEESLELLFGDGPLLLNINNNSMDDSVNTSKVSQFSKRNSSDTPIEEIMKSLDEFILAGSNSRKSKSLEGLCRVGRVKVLFLVFLLDFDKFEFE